MIAHQTDIQSDESSTWEETIAAWRGPIRGATALGVIVVLGVILIRTLAERSGGATEAYLGGLFFAVIAIGAGIAIAILTSD